MILNTAIFNAVVTNAKAKCINNAIWLRAIERAVTEILKARYWAFDGDTLTIQSLTSGKLYKVDARHECEATRNGHKACKHIAARQLMLRYTEALAADQAASVQRERERQHAILIKPQPKADRYSGMDI